MGPIGFKVLVLRAMPGTKLEIEAKSGCAKSTVQKWLLRMLDDGECHVIDWRRSSAQGSFQAVYAAGAGKSKRCPFKAYTNKQNKRRGRERLIASGENEFALAKRRARSHADKLAKQPQSWAAALFAVKR